jgi:hypothetical protein
MPFSVTERHMNVRHGGYSPEWEWNRDNLSSNMVDISLTDYCDNYKGSTIS